MKEVYKLSKSPKSDKKFRIVTPSGRSIDFGAKGYSDFTLHKNPQRMRLYVQRHGGRIPNNVLKESNNSTIIKRMLHVKSSTKENWSQSGLDTAGFWSRWLLWSFPDLLSAKQYISKTFNIHIL